MRYFYPHALEAAYMSAHHKFEYEGVMQSALNPFRWYNTDLTKDQYHSGNLYLDDASLALLKPEVGDLVIYIPKPNGFGPTDYVLLTERQLKRYNDLAGVVDCKIIQRNGKPFFWPEIEA